MGQISAIAIPQLGFGGIFHSTKSDSVFFCKLIKVKGSNPPKKREQEGEDILRESAWKIYIIYIYM